MIYTEAESTRTILPQIILPQLIRFYNTHRECINDLILSHRNRKNERETRLKNADICVEEEVKKPKKRRETKGKTKNKDARKDSDSSSHGSDKATSAINFVKDVADPDLDEEEIVEGRLFDHLTHNLKNDHSLFRIEDVDINYIVFH